MKTRRTTKGFSLVELVIVIAILAILTAIGLQIFNGVQDNARQTTAEANARLVAGALNTFNTMRPAGVSAINALQAWNEGDYLDGSTVGDGGVGVQWPQFKDTTAESIATANIVWHGTASAWVVRQPLVTW